MVRHVVTMGPETTIPEAVQLFLERQISGAPVVDDDGKLLGVISQTDVMRYQKRAPGKGEAVPSYYQLTNGEPLVAELEREASDTTCVEAIMTPAAFTVEDDTPVDEVAQCMLREHVHRLIVTRSGRLAGIVSTMDVIRGLLRRSE